MEYDELELDTLGDEKTALFVIISDTDDTFNFVVAIMYSQLLICFATRRITNTAAGFPCTSDVCLTNFQISGKYRSLKS